MRDGGVDASIRVEGFEYSDEGVGRLAGLSLLDVKDFSLRPGRVRVGSIQVDAPYVRAERDAQGVLTALGLRFPPAPAAPPAPRRGGRGVRSPRDARGELRDRRGPIGRPGASFDFSDAAPTGREAFALTAGAEFAGFSFGRDGTESRFTVEVNESRRRLAVRGAGTVSLGAKEKKVAAAFEVDGLSPDSLGRLMPEGLTITTRDGRLRFRAEADAGACPDGGSRFAARVGDLSLRDGPGGDALLTVDGIEASVARADSPGNGSRSTRSGCRASPRT